MTKVGVIARADLTGLGIQSRNWVRLLDPHKVIVINSKPFNQNEQHLEWYADRRNAFRVDGFIKTGEINSILSDIDVLLTFEIPYNYQLITAAQGRVKTIIQNNWEFTDYLLRPNLPLPDLLVNHSYWNLDEQKKKWSEITDYCPTPLFVEDYDEILEQNLARDGKKRFLHTAGRATEKDRNGTQDLLKAVKLIPEDFDFEIVIKTQTAEIGEITDKRITLDTTKPLDEKELYRGFDALILPRRYAGACLPMGEALAAGLPVIMTDIDPNDKILPKDWLIPSELKDSLMTRALLGVYSADHQLLANKIVAFVLKDQTEDKKLAREIAVKEYSSEVVKKKWEALLERLKC